MSHKAAISLLADKAAYYEREVLRFTGQANLRLRQLDERGSEGKDLKFIQTLLSNDEASIEKYQGWADELRASIKALTEAEQEAGE